MPKLYVIDDSAPNAFATGRDEGHAVVCATTGLLQMMNRVELEGVIGHELSHIKNRDMLLMTIAVVLAGFVALAANLFLRLSFFGGGNRNSRDGNNIIFLILAIVGIILAPLAAKLIGLAPSRISRRCVERPPHALSRRPCLGAWQTGQLYGTDEERESRDRTSFYQRSIWREKIRRLRRMD